MANQNFHLHKFTMDKYCLFISFLTAISAFLYLYLLNQCIYHTDQNTKCRLFELNKSHTLARQVQKYLILLEHSAHRVQ